MVVTKERPHMYFDVDHTLVRPLKAGEDIWGPNIVAVNDRLMVVNMQVVEDLKICRTRGHIVIIWSQGGSWWAETVIKALGLTPFVDVVMAKPSWYVDDKPAKDILDDSRYYYAGVF